MSGERAIAVVGSGTATATDPTRYSRNGPSFFVDPAGWLVAAAVEEALDGCPEPVLAAPDRVGVMVLSDDGPAETLTAIAGTAARGFVSPLRFAGANPGVLAGLACIRWKLRGPSLTFAMAPDAALDSAEVVAAEWLYGGQADYVLIASHRTAGGRAEARCAVARPGTPGPTLRAVLLPADLLPADPVPASRGPADPVPADPVPADRAESP